MTTRIPAKSRRADERSVDEQSNNAVASRPLRNPLTRHEKPPYDRRPEKQRPTSAMNPISQLPEPDLERREPVIRTNGPRCADGNGTLTPLFFSDDLVDIGRAKAICAKCPLTANCLSDAMDREEPWGVWGGELLLNGRIVTAKRACGRPPKRPRPVLVVDEMGAVERIA